MEGFPDRYHLFPRTERLVAGLRKFGNFLLHQETELCLSEHRRGASVMLDEALDTPLPLDGGWLPYDSEGGYIDPNNT